MVASFDARRAGPINRIHRVLYLTDRQINSNDHIGFIRFRPNSLIANRDYTSNGVNIFNKPVTHYTHKVYVTEYNPAHWLKRFVESLAFFCFVSKQKTTLSYHRFRFSRDVSKKEMFSYEDFDFTSTESPSNDTDVKLNEIERDDPIQIKASRKLRVRRQSPGRQGLCQTNSQFIIPKAALNSQGI